MSAGNRTRLDLFLSVCFPVKRPLHCGLLAVSVGPNCSFSAFGVSCLLPVGCAGNHGLALQGGMEGREQTLETGQGTSQAQQRIF